MAHTHKSTVLAQAILDLIRANKVAVGLDAESFVDYGDHNNVPGGVAVTIQAGTKNRELAGVAGPGGRTLNLLEVIVTVYYMRTAEGEAVARLKCDQIGENVEDLLHQDTTMGGIIIHGYVRQWVPGIIMRETSQFRVVQLHYVGQTKTNVTL